ncbi:MAG: ATP synthase F0 subunit B [Planctomycetota bacterium]|jgi:F0F1-type ATP synthase membrane subunit b/b'|nr:ATP synthase F0 subunit B [Planctomycetota bacterium]
MAKNSVKHNPGVSRHTMVIRKAREDDARRLAEANPEAADGFKPPSRPALAKTRRSSTEIVRIPRKKPSADPMKNRGLPPSQSRVPMDGATSAIPGGGDFGKISSVTRFFGPARSSGRSARGNTLVRYESGRMEIRRGARQLSIRRQILLGYAIGYFLLFSLYGYFLLSGKVEISPEDFVQRGFALRRGTGVEDLERAAFEAMRGFRTPAEVRLAEALSFYDENKEMLRVEAGSRLTLPVAAKLGKAILEDMKLPEKVRVFTRPLTLYQESFLASLDWPHWLTVYNSIGFFLLAAVFLWRPFMNYLAVQGRKTAAALKNAREAREATLTMNGKYAELDRDIDIRKADLLAEAEADGAARLAETLAAAKIRADDIAGGILNSLEIETGRRAARLGGQTALLACNQAREILEKRLGEAEHAAAIEELIACILAWRPEAALAEAGAAPAD